MVKTKSYGQSRNWDYIKYDQGNGLNREKIYSYRKTWTNLMETVMSQNRLKKQKKQKLIWFFWY